MSAFRIVAVKVARRRDLAARVQEIFTDFGCIIQMRLGLHEAGDRCSDQGLILLEVTDAGEQTRELLQTLNGVEGVTAKLLEI